MSEEKIIKLYSFTMDCLNPEKLATFYASLMDWEVMFSTEDWACTGVKGSKQGAYPGILFQKNPNYQRPVWPEEPEKQQQMAHLDFAVNDLEYSIEYAIQIGAMKADNQFSTDWTVMFDPEGHPFCLCKMKEIMETEEFKLL